MKLKILCSKDNKTSVRIIKSGFALGLATDVDNHSIGYLLRPGDPVCSFDGQMAVYNLHRTVTDPIKDHRGWIQSFRNFSNNIIRDDIIRHRNINERLTWFLWDIRKFFPHDSDGWIIEGITHEALSLIVHAKRETVTLAMGDLRRSGFIKKENGKVRKFYIVNKEIRKKVILL